MASSRCAGPALAAAQHEQRADRAQDGGQGQQRARRVPALELVRPQERGDRLVHLGPAAVGRPEQALVERLVRGALDADDDLVAGPQADLGREHRVVRLELPARDRRDALDRRPGSGEQPGRVAQEAAQHAQRLLVLDRRLQLGQHLALGHAGRDHRVVQRRVLGVLQPVRAVGLGARARAHLAQVGGQLEGRAVRGHRQPAQVLVRAGGQPEVAGHVQGAGAVDEDRQDERRDQDRRLAQDPPPAAVDGQDQVGHRGQHQDLADLVDRGRGAQDQAGHDREPRRHHRPPQQDHQPRDDHGLEQHVGHDHLLHLELIGVQQYRRGGHCRQPAGRAPADQDRVQRHRHGQAHQVLEHRHRAQVGDRQHDLEQHLVPERVGAGPFLVQVLERVDVEQRRVIRHEGQHAQDHARDQQQRDQPVPAQQHQGGGAGPGGGRLAASPERSGWPVPGRAITAWTRAANCGTVMPRSPHGSGRHLARRGRAGARRSDRR